MYRLIMYFFKQYEAKFDSVLNHNLSILCFKGKNFKEYKYF